ncbi:MAG TPA: ABC transporter permease [Vicinamibacterales bacterium]|nr:ABC transporter permease [Vicinamibacterales bacterium]
MNQFIEAIAIALNAVWTNKLRSFLTVLGNIVAVTSIIAVVSLIQGMNSYVTNAIITDVGADNFTIQRYPPIRSEEDEDRIRNNPPITLADAAALQKFGGNIGAVAAQATASGRAEYRNESMDSLQIQGVSKNYVLFSTFTAGQGRLISPSEIERDVPVTVLGYDTADRLFKGEDPIDKTLSINGLHFRVVGVSEKKGSSFGQSQDEFAIIPLGMFQKLFGVRPNLQIIVKPRDPNAVHAAMDDATVALRIERRLKPGKPDNFGVFAADTLLNLFHTATNGIFAVLIGVVSLSLVVGGIVIMNIMLMVVTERTREIGLRKALGARRREIVWQILTESVTLSVLGGLIGTFLGFAAAIITSKLTPLPASVETWSVAIGIGITAVVGLFFGLYPAMRAAALDPIEALRRE